MRTAGPSLGGFFMAHTRLTLAGVAAFTVLLVAGGLKLDRPAWRHGLVMAVINAGVPFCLFSFAASQKVPASYLAVINSLALAFGMVFTWLLLGERPTIGKFLAALLGMAGVAVAVGLEPLPEGPGILLGLILAVGAPICYGLTAVYLRMHGGKADKNTLAAITQLGGGLMLSWAWFMPPPAENVTLKILICLVVLALFCTAWAYGVYFKLIENIGASKTLTVVLLIPIFGITWSVIFLNEKLTLELFIGAAMVLVSSYVLIRPGQKVLKPEASKKPD